MMEIISTTIIIIITDIGPTGRTMVTGTDGKEKEIGVIGTETKIGFTATKVIEGIMVIINQTFGITGIIGVIMEETGDGITKVDGTDGIETEILLLKPNLFGKKEKKKC